MIKECSEQRYDEALGCLPPAMWVNKGFLLGEPHDHRVCGISKLVLPTYAAFFYYQGKFYEGDPMTVYEFTNFDVTTLAAPD